MEIKKEYSNGEITIVWKPSLCIHSGICVHKLPEVYQPQEKPWIKIGAASTTELVEQVKTCPSGALSYYYTKNREKMKQQGNEKSQETEILISKNGPLLVKGNFVLLDAERNPIKSEGVIALCRCGASANKPYCDGSHARIGFVDGQ